MDSNWKRATDANKVEALSAEAELELIQNQEDKGLCGIPEPEIPAPTMRRCKFLKGHKDLHSWEIKGAEV